MSWCSVKAFTITTILYSALGYGVYQWMNHEPEKKIIKVSQQVPIQLSMFHAPTPVPIEEPPKPVIEPPKPVEKVVEKPKPKPKPKKIVPKKVVEKKPEPIKKTKPIEVVKQQPVQKPIEPPKKVEPPKNQYAVVQKEEKIEKVVAQPSYTLAETMNAEKQYLSELNHVLAMYAQDTYPRRAKRRNWESDVTVTFEILKNGRITNLKISDHGSREIFDEAALDIFRDKLQMRFKAFPEKIERERWSLQVPISYTLR